MSSFLKSPFIGDHLLKKVNCMNSYQDASTERFLSQNSGEGDTTVHIDIDMCFSLSE